MHLNYVLIAELLKEIVSIIMYLIMKYSSFTYLQHAIIAYCSQLQSAYF